MVHSINLHHTIIVILVTSVLAQSGSWHFSGKNIALNKPTEQWYGTWSGQFTDEGENVYITASSNLAVDGNKASEFGQGSCSHTTGLPNTRTYWSVDLSDTYFLKGVRVYTRNLYKSRYDNFKIIGHPSGTTIHDDATAETKLARDDIINIMVTPAQFANVTIIVPANTTWHPSLCLCEVEIYGELDLNYCSSESTDDQLIWSISYGYMVRQRNLVVAESIVQFSCMSHHTLVGAVSVTCLATGFFNASLPRCLEKTCQAPPTISNGAYTLNLKMEYSFYETVQWECSEGYKSDQNRTRQCLPTSDWSDVDPICKLATCLFPSDFSDGNLVYLNGTLYTQETVPSGTIVTVVCDRCLTSNTDSILCGQDEEWSIAPQCVQAECASLGSFIGGHYTYRRMATPGHTYVCGTVTEVSCYDNFRKTFENRTCEQDGSWSGGDTQPCVAEQTNDSSHGTVSVFIAGGIGGGMLVIGIGIGIAVAVFIWKWRTRCRSKHPKPAQPRIPAHVDSSYDNIANVGTDCHDYTELTLTRDV